MPSGVPRPRRIWAEVQSVIVLTHNYAPANDPMEKLSLINTGNISCYAQGADYHEVIKKKLKSLARIIAQQLQCEVKVFVDTAPVMEKPLAESAGLGWQGKHTCIVSRTFGSWLFLGEIFTSLSLPPDTPETDHCGNCSRCLDVLPHSGIHGSAEARCAQMHLLPYHRTQGPHRPFPIARQSAIASMAATIAWPSARGTNSRKPRARSRIIRANGCNRRCWGELAGLDDMSFRALFRASAVKRIGRDRFVRNVLIAIGNSGDISHLPRITALLGRYIASGSRNGRMGAFSACIRR